LFALYNGTIGDISSRKGTGYISFYEDFEDQLKRLQTSKSFTRFSFLAFYRDYLIREMILRRSFDEIARINGWELHIDGVHLNTRGGRILMGLVQQFLSS